MSTTHVVSQGDCIVTIAKQYGFLKWQTLWDHPKNAGLKAKRKNKRGQFVELSNELRVKMIGNAVSSPVATMLGQAVVTSLLAA